jgi:phage shock protein PspC (stress-responsive transcriptional regulator)
MEPTGSKKLLRSSSFVVGGVCSGLAKHYGLRKDGVQAVFLYGSLFFGFLAFVYLALWLVLEKED